MRRLLLDGTPLSLAVLRDAATAPLSVELSAGVQERIVQSAHAVETIVASGKVTYGINTGFGLLASKTIPREQLATLQRNLVLSHSTGVGAALDDRVVRLVLLLKIVGLARAHSGIRLSVIEALVRLLQRDVLPVIPAKGSVGASGDLAPLAHMSACLLGQGQMRHQGRTMPAAEGLALAGLAPLQLVAKEGLALLNGTQVSTALALSGLFAIEDVFAAGIVAGALSVDAAQGSDTPFDARIHELRGQPGQIATARLYRSLLEGSEIRESHRACTRVQDPYSLRCQPQVMGACLDQMRNAARTLQIEANAVTDNPLIFAPLISGDDATALSGGNFHAEPVAMAADNLALAAAEIGALSERRLALLIDPAMSGLPAFLVAESGVNSGFMIAQVTAAALASENKCLAHPASVDSMPTSANQEDHVSMATHAARRLEDMAENSANIVAIELLAATQGVEFRAPNQSSPPLRQAMAAIRERVARWEQDRYFAPDIQAARDMVRAGSFRTWTGALLP